MQTLTRQGLGEVFFTSLGYGSSRISCNFHSFPARSQISVHRALYSILHVFCPLESGLMLHSQVKVQMAKKITAKTQIQVLATCVTVTPRV